MTGRHYLLLVLVAAVAVGIGGLAAQRRQAPAARELFPRDGAGAWGRIALYIGVDVYPDESIKNLAAPLNDIEALREVMRSKYGFRRDAVVTGKFATRAGIGEALRTLIGQVKKASQRRVAPVVLLFFGGHGSLVADDDEPDEKARGFPSDSTWVAYDSDRQAANDIRDDDVNRVLGELERLGATVVYLTDSCHSGSSYRGDDTADDDGGTQARGVTRRRLYRGPRESLFPELAWKHDLRTASFVACHDVQLAQERRPPDKGGRVMGCFTYSVIKVLEEPGGPLTYEQFGERVIARFSRDWSQKITRRQKPIFDVPNGLRQRPLFSPR